VKICLVFLALTLLTGLAQARGPQEERALYREGREVFENICADCHRLNGRGLPGTYPALDQDAFVLGDPQLVILTVLNGRKGALGRMPTWKDKLDDRQIAGAITYIRNSWSNRAPAVTPGMVAALRGP